MLALFAALLGGCAYKPLKAPCAPEEDGAALAFTETPARKTPEAFTSLDTCGPMRPI